MSQQRSISKAKQTICLMPAYWSKADTSVLGNVHTFNSIDRQPEIARVPGGSA